MPIKGHVDALSSLWHSAVFLEDAILLTSSMSRSHYAQKMSYYAMLLCSIISVIMLLVACYYAPVSFNFIVCLLKVIVMVCDLHSYVSN